MYFTLTFLPVTCHMSHVIHFEFSLSEEKICIAKFVLFCFHCIHVFRPLCLKMNERRYLEVVSGSGKFILAVSTGYLCGICCNLCASVFT